MVKCEDGAWAFVNGVGIEVFRGLNGCAHGILGTDDKSATIFGRKGFEIPKTKQTKNVLKVPGDDRLSTNTGCIEDEIVVASISLL